MRSIPSGAGWAVGFTDATSNVRFSAACPSAAACEKTKPHAKTAILALNGICRINTASVFQQLFDALNGQCLRNCQGNCQASVLLPALLLESHPESTPV